MRQTIIELNWRTRPIRKPKILKGHDEHVITCLQFYGNRIVSGSDDNTLKVWSAITGKVSCSSSFEKIPKMYLSFFVRLVPAQFSRTHRWRLVVSNVG